MKMFKSTILLALSILFVSNVFGQERKFTLTYEYLPHISGIEGLRTDGDIKLSHHGLLRIQSSGESKFKSTIGLGFLNTGETNSFDIAPGFGIDRIKYRDNYNYLFIPIGIKYMIGKFYILPEVGVGYNINNKRRSTTWLDNGETLNDNLAVPIPANFKKITLPLMLSIGGEFKLNQFVISSGIKAYYGLNNMASNNLTEPHYRGVGVFLGIGF